MGAVERDNSDNPFALFKYITGLNQTGNNLNAEKAIDDVQDSNHQNVVDVFRLNGTDYFVKFFVNNKDMQKELNNSIAMDDALMNFFPKVIYAQGGEPPDERCLESESSFMHFLHWFEATQTTMSTETADEKAGERTFFSKPYGSVFQLFHLDDRCSFKNKEYITALKAASDCPIPFIIYEKLKGETLEKKVMDSDPMVEGWCHRLGAEMRLLHSGIYKGRDWNSETYGHVHNRNKSKTNIANAIRDAFDERNMEYSEIEDLVNERLSSLPDYFDRKSAVFVHSDLKLDNLLCCKDGLKVVDSETAKRGDHNEDFGVLFGYLDYLEILSNIQGARPFDKEVIIKAILLGYTKWENLPDNAERKLDEDKINLYRTKYLFYRSSGEIPHLKNEEYSPAKKSKSKRIKDACFDRGMSLLGIKVPKRNATLENASEKTTVSA